MSKFQDYVPQPFAVYRMMPNHPDYPLEYHYQNRNLSQCSEGNSLFSLTLPFDGTHIAFPGFMVRKPAGGAAITDWVLQQVGAPLGATISGVTSSEEDLDEVPDWAAVIFPGQKHAFTPTVGTEYYLRFTDGVDTWYTETFKFAESATISSGSPWTTMPLPCGADEFLQMSWSNPTSVISEKFPTGALFTLTLPVNVSQPKYEYKPESDEDGEGTKVYSFHRLEKRHSFFIVAPEFIADALSAAQMFKNIGISFQWGDTMNCRDLVVDVDWNTPCYAKITVSFTADFLTRTACG